MEANNQTMKQILISKCSAKRLKQDPSTTISPQSTQINDCKSGSPTATLGLMLQNHDNTALDLKKSSDSAQATSRMIKSKNLRISLRIQRTRIHLLNRTMMSLSEECQRIDQENKAIEEELVRRFGQNVLKGLHTMSLDHEPGKVSQKRHHSPVPESDF